MSITNFFFADEPTFGDTMRNIFLWLRGETYSYSGYESKMSMAFLMQFFPQFPAMLGTVTNHFDTGEVLIYVFVGFCCYLGIEFASILDVFGLKRGHIDPEDQVEPITFELLQNHVENVNSLIAQMTQNRKSIIKQLWDLQIPMAMMKYEQMLDENETNFRPSPREKVY